MDIKPATPPRDPPAPPPLWSVVVMAGVWWAAIVVHFLVCGLCAYLLGDPVDIPFWLKPWDKLFTHGISGFLALVLILVWWTAVTLLFAPVAAIAWVCGRAVYALTPDSAGDVERDGAFWQALGVMTPLLVMALLSLLILPMQAPHHIDSESGLEIADQVSYAAFVEYQFLSMFAMFVLLVMFGTIFGGAAVIATYAPDLGIFAFLTLIVAGIIVSMIAAFALGPFVLELPTQVGVYEATAIIFAGLALLTGLPTLVMLRKS